jgi:uncharacterized protein YeaO (DUF488 family)
MMSEEPGSVAAVLASAPTGRPRREAPEEANMRGRVTVARIYDDAADAGRRVLVDRVWPRGVSKDAARLDRWLKDIAPSTELRRWYGHDPARFTEFRRRYEAELSGSPAAGALQSLRDLAAEHPVVLLTATRDVPHSHAAVLAALLAHEGSGERPGPAC